MNSEGGALAHATLDGNRAAVGVDDCLTDGEPEAGVTVARGTRFVAAEKAFEDVGQVIGRNPLSAVLDLQDRTSVFEARSDFNPPVELIELDGVGEEVGDDLGNAVGVAESRSGRQVGGDGDGLFLGEGSDQINAGIGNFVELEGTGFEHLLSCVETGELHERLGEPPHLLSGLKADLDRFAVFGGGPFAGKGGLGFRDQDG